MHIHITDCLQNLYINIHVYDTHYYNQDPKYMKEAQQLELLDTTPLVSKEDIKFSTSNRTILILHTSY